MSKIRTSDVVFFFGAGASAPFGIPTMKQFVTDFEESLSESGTKHEQKTYTDIKETLKKRLHRQVDLESIFTVIDGIINYSSERLGLLSLYSATGFKESFPNKIDVNICKSLRQKFQTFVRDKCVIPEESFDKIRRVYHDFFNRFALELRASGTNSRGDYHWQTDWAIFTTNYDTCLEYYWREVARAGIDTGFEFDRVRTVNTLRPDEFLDEETQLKLFKLHGSVNWLIEKGTNEVIEEEMARGRSHMGRRFRGEMMLYPIAEKELYLNPYISMLLRLNRELERKPVWVVIGYSFNDPVVREIFLSKSKRGKHLILVHPEATTVCDDKVHRMKGKQSPLNRKFGLEDNFRRINCLILRTLKDTLRYDCEETPIP